MLASVGSKKLRSGFSGQEITLPGNVIGFEVRTSPDPKNPGNQIYQAVFSDGHQENLSKRMWMNVHIRIIKLKCLNAQGVAAFEQPVPKG